MPASKSPEFKTRVGVDGDATYKQALSDIARSLTVLKTDMTATQSAFADQAGSVDALTEKQKNLQEQYELQAEKVRLTAEQLEAAKAKYGENSKEADNLEIALNRAKTAMNNTNTELGKTNTALDEAKTAAAGATEGTDELTGAADEAAGAVEGEGTAADKAAGETSGFKEALSAAGEAAKAGIVAAVEGVAAAFTAVGAAAAAAVGAAYEFAQGAGTMADNVLTLSTQTGVSAEALQGWTYAANFIDTDVEVITGSMARMVKAMGEAQGGSETAAEKFAALGVSITNSDGSLRNTQEVFAEAIDALGNMSNETERDAAAMELFGKKAQDLNPLIEAGGGALAALSQEAASMGTVFSGEALTAMGGFDDSMQRMNATFDGMKNAIGLTVIPAFQPLVDTATEAMAGVSVALQDGLQPGELEGLVTSLVGTVSSAMTEVTGLITEAIPVVTEALSGIVGTLVETLPGLVEQLLPAATGLLQGLLDAIVANVEPLTAMAVSLVSSIATFLIENVDKLLDAAVGIVTGLIDGITDKLPELIPLAVEMMVKLAVSLVEAIPQLVAKLPEICTAIWEGLAAVDWIGLGLDLINGLVNGLTSAVSSLLDAIKGVFTGIWNAILGVFGIASPSTLASEAAGNILAGLLEGFESAVTAVCDAVMRIFGKIWEAIKSIFGFGSESEESKEAKSAGKDIMTGMQSGIEDNKGPLENAVKDVSKAVLQKFNDELGIEGSTSTKTKPFGEAAAMGVNDGMKSKGVSGTYTGGANAIGEAASSALRDALGIGGTGWFGSGTQVASKFTAVGDAIAEGVAKGINDGAGKITSAAKTAAQNAYAAACKELGISSPSKRMREVGLFFDEGFAEGVSDGMGAVLSGARALSNMAAGEVHSATTRGEQAVQIDYDKLGRAVAKANRDAGLGDTTLAVDGYTVGKTLEPSVSRWARNRAGQTVRARGARMVLV